MKELLWVGFGGLAGSVLRFWMATHVQRRAARWWPDQPWPWGTWLVNLAGCLLIGLLMGWAERRGVAQWPRLLLVTGFCGGFTTFSAYSFETLALLRAGRPAAALLYAAGSVLLGLAAVALGYGATRGGA